MSGVGRSPGLGSRNLYLGHRVKFGETLATKHIGILRAHSPDLSLHSKHRRCSSLTMLGHLTMCLLDMFAWIQGSNFIEYISFRIGEPEIQAEYAEHAIR